MYAELPVGCSQASNVARVARSDERSIELERRSNDEGVHGMPRRKSGLRQECTRALSNLPRQVTDGDAASREQPIDCCVEPRPTTHLREHCRWNANEGATLESNLQDRASPLREDATFASARKRMHGFGIQYQRFGQARLASPTAALDTGP